MKVNEMGLNVTKSNDEYSSCGDKDKSILAQSDEFMTENSCASEEAHKMKKDGFFRQKDLDYLIGNLEKLPASARKLFSMGKLYLTTGASTKSEDDPDFLSLFQALPQHSCDDFEERVPSYGEEAENNIQSALASPQYRTSLFVPLKRSAPLYRAQTYIGWKAARDLGNVYALCLPKRRTMYLQPLEEFPHFIQTFCLHVNHLQFGLLELLQGFAQIYFSGLEVCLQSPVSVEVSGLEITTRLHEVTQQKQYCVNSLYPYLQSLLPNNGLCIVGVTWTDIYSEGFNFVLGEASNKHHAAVVSFGRFETKDFDRNTHSDVSEVDGKLIWKLMKSLSHEVCHLLGLEHCTFFCCAMNESASVSEALSQPLFLCPVCLRKLQRACGFDVLERYQLMQKFLSSLTLKLDNTSSLQESLNWISKCVSYLEA